MLTLFFFILFVGFFVILFVRVEVFNKWLKSDFGWVLLLSIFALGFGLSSFLNSTISQHIFPLQSDYGMNQNEVRALKGMPLIGNDWKEVEEMGNQFRIWYLNSKDSGVHKKKRIEFDKWGAIFEEDFFKTPSGESYVSVYDYESDKSEYFLLEPELLNAFDKRIEISKEMFDRNIKKK